jgi:SAM-dependent methyltransferase
MTRANEAQIEFWNGRAAEKWVAEQQAMDAMLAPVTAALTARARVRRGERVLDIGCGTGATCVIWLAEGAEVTGVDVSAPMLAVAAARTAGKAELVEADASAWVGDAPFDLAVSRFGVMFFDAPESAFTRIAANLRPGGRLVFVCWRAVAHNPWVSTPMGAIRDLLPETPVPDPSAPGPFSLADRGRLAGILESAGFTSVAIDPLDVALGVASEGGAGAAVRFLLELGPAARALAEVDETTRARAAARLLAALLPFERDGRVTLGGAIWVVEAVRP